MATKETVAEWMERGGIPEELPAKGQRKGMRKMHARMHSVPGWTKSRIRQDTIIRRVDAGR